jgi:hypothetical protein
MLPYDVSIKYMLLGYGIILGMLISYVINMTMRWRKRKREYLQLHSGKEE